MKSSRLRLAVALAILLAFDLRHQIDLRARAQVTLPETAGLLSDEPRLLDESSYNRALQRRHFDLTRDQLIALGEQEYRRIDADMTALAKQIDGTKTWREIIQTFERTSHPGSLSDVIPAYDAELRRAKAFVLAKDLVTLPPAPELSVHETPRNLVNSVAYAIYMFKIDVLFVTLAAGGGDDEAEALSTHNDGLIAVAAVHEGYPGHRTQNLIRTGSETNEDTETESEGWGLYVEELMLRAGYYDGQPAPQKLFALRMLLHRAARAFLDPKIHRRDLTPQQASRVLTDQVGLSKQRASIEAARYVNSPGSAATYLVGKRQIEQLRRQVKAEEGDRFTLKHFHDRLLTAGAVPVQTIAQQVFHVELDSAGVFHLDAVKDFESGAPMTGVAHVVGRSAVVSVVVLTLGLASISLRRRRRAGRRQAGL